MISAAVAKLPSHTNENQKRLEEETNDEMDEEETEFQEDGSVALEADD